MKVRKQRTAAGSHATFGPYPRVCVFCGQPVRMGGDTALWFESTAADGFKPRSWHHGCRLHVLRQKPKEAA